MMRGRYALNVYGHRIYSLIFIETVFFAVMNVPFLEIQKILHAIEGHTCLSAEDGKLMNKDVFIRKCEARGDEQAADITFRLLTVSDLAASDCRYHKDCFSKFYSNPVPQQSSSQDDLSFKVLLKIIKSDTNRIWTSSSFAEQYSQL